MLHCKNSSKAVLDHCKNIEKRLIPHPQSPNKYIELNFLTEKDVINLLQKIKTISEVKKENIKEWLISLELISDGVVLDTRKEIEFVAELSDFLEAQNITDGISQFRILNYQIDYYIPSLKLAIEYDEKGHKYYSYERQEGRQLKIEKELGCEFIRVSDDKSNAYNIGLIAKKICA